MAKSLSVRETEALVRKALDDRVAGRAPKARPRSRDLVSFEESVAEALGTKVEIQPAKKGGRLVIHYSSNDHLADLLEQIKR